MCSRTTAQIRKRLQRSSAGTPSSLKTGCALPLRGLHKKESSFPIWCEFALSKSQLGDLVKDWSGQISGLLLFLFNVGEFWSSRFTAGQQVILSWSVRYQFFLISHRSSVSLLPFKASRIVTEGFAEFDWNCLSFVTNCRLVVILLMWRLLKWIEKTENVFIWFWFSLNFLWIIHFKHGRASQYEVWNCSSEFFFNWCSFYWQAKGWIHAVLYRFDWSRMRIT